MAKRTKSRGRIFVYLGLLVILGVALLYVLNISPQTGGDQAAQFTPTPMEEMSSIVISIQPIKFGTVISPEMVTVIPYPQRLIVPGVFFTEINEVVGKKAIMDLDAKVPITNTLLSDTETGSIDSYKIPTGMVAISIPIQNPLSSVGYIVQPGDHVNLIGTMMFVDVDTNFQSRLPNLSSAVAPPGSEDLLSMVAVVQSMAVPSPQGRAEQDPSLAQPLYLSPSESQRPRIVSQTLLQNVVVLRVGEYIPEGKSIVVSGQLTPTPTPAGQTQQPAPEPIIRPQLVTVVVSPQDAVALNYLVYSGVQINLALRSAGDEQVVQTDSVSLQYAIDSYQITVPSKFPYSLEPAITILSLPNVETAPIPY